MSGYEPYTVLSLNIYIPLLVPQKTMQAVLFLYETVLLQGLGLRKALADRHLFAKYESRSLFSCYALKKLKNVVMLCISLVRSLYRHGPPKPCLYSFVHICNLSDTLGTFAARAGQSCWPMPC